MGYKYIVIYFIFAGLVIVTIIYFYRFAKVNNSNPQFSIERERERDEIEYIITSLFDQVINLNNNLAPPLRSQSPYFNTLFAAAAAEAAEANNYLVVSRVYDLSAKPTVTHALFPLPLSLSLSQILHHFSLLVPPSIPLSLSLWMVYNKNNNNSTLLIKPSILSSFSLPLSNGFSKPVILH